VSTYRGEAGPSNITVEFLDEEMNDAFWAMIAQSSDDEELDWDSDEESE
jgi:hypothetical protein